MRFGIWAPLPHAVRPEPAIVAGLADLQTRGVGQPVDRSYAFLLDVVRRAEALGFDLTLVAERLVAPDLEAWVTAAAVAVQTSRIEIMTAVHPGIVSPQVVAKMGASLDRLSGGRFAINVVPGNRPQEFELYGNGAWVGDSGQRYRRMDEFIRVMKGLWTEDELTLKGEFYTVRKGALAIRTLQVPAPPVYAASGADAGMEIIARECHTWFVSHEPGLDARERNLHKIEHDIADMRTRARRYGRSLGYGISTHVICAPSEEAAIAEARALENTPGAGVAAKALGAGLVGTPATIIARIEHLQRIGIDCLMLQFHPMREGLETFAEKIMPHIH